MSDSEIPKNPDRIFQRRSTFGFKFKEMGFATLREFHDYTDRGAELAKKILAEAGSVSELEIRANLLTDPAEPNANEDLLRIRQDKNSIIVSVTNPKNNNFEFSSIHFRIMNDKTINPVSGEIVDGEFDSAPDWDLMGAVPKSDLDKLYKILESVIERQLHKPKIIEASEQPDLPRFLE